jgi:NADH-quinone oxidoreductase subunit J
MDSAIEEVLQVVLMIATVLLALFAIETKNILHAVIGFCGMCITIGGLFWLLNAPYVSVFQILIYAGAVVAIFLAAVMFTTSKESIK